MTGNLRQRPVPPPLARPPSLLRVWIWPAVAGLVAGIAFSVRLDSAFGMVLAPFAALGVMVGIVFPLRWWRRRDAVDVRRELVIPGVVLLALLAAREGAFGSYFRLNVNISRSDSHADWKSSTNTSRHSPPAPSRRRIAITLDGADGQIATAIRDALESRRWRSDDVAVDVHADVSDTWCLLPLYKSATVAPRLTADIRWNGPRSSGSSTLELRGTIAMRVVGVCSRMQFNEEVGEVIAARLAEEADEQIVRD